MGLTKNEATIVCSKLSETSFKMRVEKSSTSKLNRDEPMITGDKVNQQISGLKPVQGSTDNKITDDKNLPISREIKIEKDIGMEV